MLKTGLPLLALWVWASVALVAPQADKSINHAAAANGAVASSNGDHMSAHEQHAALADYRT